MPLLPDLRTVYTLAIIFYGCGLCAQTSTSTATSTPVRAAAVRPADIREKLVRLALQNPDYEVADRQLTIAGYQVKKAKGGWLSVLAVQGNLNEFAFKKSITVNGITYNPSVYYPKYNIGANIPFSLFSDKKNDIKIAKENVSIAEAGKNQRFREIKAEVLTKYEDYLLYQQKLDLQTQITQDTKTAYLASEKDFKEGAIKQDEYNKSYRGYVDEKIRQAEYQRDFNVVKLQLEKMIGVSMDDVIKK
jgi:outer membrane protein TolC